MRRIGNLSDETLAERFRDYLTTQSIDSSIDAGDDEEAPGNFDVWIRDEKDVSRARELLEEFRASPKDSRFDASAEAQRIRERRVADNIKKLKFRRAAPMRTPSAMGGMTGGFPTRQQAIPVTLGILILSVVTSFTTRFGSPLPSQRPGEYSFEQKLYCTLSFLDPREEAPPEGIAQDSFASIKKGELWRFVTPLFMHGGTFHLLFNMLWIYSLGSMIERLHGSIFFLLLALITQTIGMLVQVLFPEALGGTPNAIGASGAVYGLFGYLWIRPMVDPTFPIRLAPMNVALMLGWLVLCFFPFMPGIANGAHLGGLMAGMASAPLMGQTRS